MKGYSIPVLAAVVFLSGSLAYGQARITKLAVSEKACPLKVFEAPTQDKQKAMAVVRQPPGKGPFPAIMFLHGGQGQLDENRLKRVTVTQSTRTRFLAAGYVTVNATSASGDKTRRRGMRSLIA